MSHKPSTPSTPSTLKPASPAPTPAPTRRSSRRDRVTRPLAAGACALSLASIALLSPSSARADNSGEVAAATLLLAGGIADITFLAYDASVAGNNEMPSSKWALAELIVTLPQTGILMGAASAFAIERREPEVTLGILPFVLLTGALTTHGAFRLMSVDVDPKTLFWLSPAIGMNLTLTSVAITAMFGERRLVIPEVGVAEVVLTLPPLIGGLYALGLEDSSKVGWAALTGWSSALLIHGVASIIADRGRNYDASVAPPSERAPRWASLRPSLKNVSPGIVAAPLDGKGPPIYGLVAAGSF